jgi:hypothetical protein
MQSIYHYKTHIRKIIIVKKNKSINLPIQWNTTFLIWKLYKLMATSDKPEFHDLAAALVFIWFCFSINNIDTRGWRYTFFVHHTAICECRVTTSMIREVCIDIFDRATFMLSLTNCKHLWATLRSSPSSVSQILRQSKKFLIRNNTKTCKWAFFPIKMN